MHERALKNQQILNQQHMTQQHRATAAISKLQQKLLDEQNEKEIRAQWRRNAIQMAQIPRSKLQKQLEQQYFTYLCSLIFHPLSFCEW